MHLISLNDKEPADIPQVYKFVYSKIDFG